MAKILIIGAGAMGTAFAFPCFDRFHKVKIVGTHLEDKLIDSLNNKKKFHPTLKKNIPNKIQFIKFSSFATEFKKKTNLIVIAVNSKGIYWVASQLRNVTKNNNLPPILMLTKGLSIYKHKYELLVDKLRRKLIENGFKNLNISAVGGPCLAEGLANRVHSSVIFANKNLKTVNWLKKILSTNYYHISTTDDIVGVEICAAIKNIFSMVIGASKGLCYEKINTKNKEINYLNTSASLIRQSVYEMEIFVKFLKGKRETVLGLAGLADLYVSSAGGRNSRMGFFIGEGYVYSKAKKIKMPNDTIEGADLAFELGKKIKKDFNLKKLPIMIGMIDAILNDKSLKINWKNFKENKNE